VGGPQNLFGDGNKEETSYCYGERNPSCPSHTHSLVTEPFQPGVSE